MEKEIDYSPPGWIVSWFDNVKLDPERAEKFHDMRLRLCEALGKNNKACHHNTLWLKALDLLLANESVLLVKVEQFDEQGNKVEK
jgi:hypothetical protein